MKETYLLHGIADRDPDELVAMFFKVATDLEEFRAMLPGKYRVLILRGINFDDIEVLNATLD